MHTSGLAMTTVGFTSSDAFGVSFTASFSSHSPFFSGGSCERTHTCQTSAGHRTEYAHQAPE